MSTSEHEIAVTDSNGRRLVVVEMIFGPSPDATSPGGILPARKSRFFLHKLSGLEVHLQADGTFLVPSTGEKLTATPA